MKRVLFITILLLAGCASTGVVLIGTNEYMISKTGDVWHQGANELAKVYIEANEYCAKKGLSLERISEETQDGQVFVRNANATLRFRCITARQ